MAGIRYRIEHTPVPVASNVQKVAAGSSHSLVVASGLLLFHTPAFTSQPENRTTLVGSTVTFTVEATGIPAFQWQVSYPSGIDWTNLADGSP